MAAINTYGDIPPQVAKFAIGKMLMRGIPNEILGKILTPHVLPSHSSKVLTLRRFEALSNTGITTPLVEGVPPAGQTPTKTDVDITVQQYGNWVGFSDLLLETIDSPYMQEVTDILGEQMSQIAETIRWNAVKAGTNKEYANGSARTDVNTPINIDMQRRCTRTLFRGNAKPIGSKISSNGNFRTEPVEQHFPAVTHVDVENDIRRMPGYISPKQYRSGNPEPGEIGAVDNVVYYRSTLFTPFADGGAAKSGSGTTMVSTTGTSSDVYPVVYFGQDAAATVVLRGMNSASIKVVAPRPAIGQPLGQQGTAGWLMAMAAAITNDNFLNRGEVAATA
jgi:N4-gp56 family major capsid protein